VARLFADANFPLPVVEELRVLHHDVATIQGTDKAGVRLPDQEVLELAIDDNRAVLTLNRKHFIHLHRQSPSHAGIIVCTVDRDFLGQAQRIHAALQTTTRLAGQLLRVNRPS
jgi:hypothetical protein